MKIHNFLPEFLRCVERWSELPALQRFIDEYFSVLQDKIGVAFDGAALHSALAEIEIDWENYRESVLRIDPAREQARLSGHVERVEALFGFPLEGEAILFGSFATIDGYARFDRGTHRVFLGVDESYWGGRVHGSGSYLDILETHELTHVARESRPSVWEGWGLDPRMSHDDFSERQPVVEHVFGEGFSCAISELLVPCDEPWHYAYQEPESLKRVIEHASSVDEAVHREIRAGEQGDWSRLYNPASYRPRLPVFTHYVWGWRWAAALLRDRAAGDPRKLVGVCSREWVEDALEFSLSRWAGSWPGIS